MLAVQDICGLRLSPAFWQNEHERAYQRERAKQNPGKKPLPSISLALPCDCSRERRASDNQYDPERIGDDRS